MTKLVYEGDMMEVLKKMTRAKQLAQYLPGIDCGACGSPGCKCLAEDIVRGEAAFANCIFMQGEMVRRGKMTPGKAMEKLDEVWGEDRMKLNVNKLEDNEA